MARCSECRAPKRASEMRRSLCVSCLEKLLASLEEALAEAKKDNRALATENATLARSIRLNEP